MDRYDVVVVGSGFGGAVCAANLARAGLRVCVLERGGWWGRSQGRRPFPESGLATARAVHSVHLSSRRWNLSLRLNSRGLLEFHYFDGLSIIAGVGVGGSSLVYGGLCQRPPPDFFDAFPAEVTASELEPYYRAIEEVVQPSVCPVTDPKSEHFQKVSSALPRARTGYLEQAIFWGDGPEAEQVVDNRWGVRQANCTLRNRCTPGCNRGAKNSLDLNLIPAAMAAGAQVRHLCRVDRVRRAGRGYAVDYRNLQSRRRSSVEADRVVLAAGTLNTHRLLFRSRSDSDGLPALSPMLGRRFSTGADAVKSYPRRDFSFGYGAGHLLEAAVEVFDEDQRRDHYVFPSDLALGELLPGRRPSPAERDRTLNLVGFGRDDANGELGWSGKRLTLALPQQEGIGRIYATMYALSRSYGQTGDALPLGREDEVPRPRRARMSAHPMGGCRMADTPENGVVDHRGEVFGYPDLYIADASIFAGPPVCAPSLTIAAMAWRISDQIVHRESA